MWEWVGLVKHSAEVGEIGEFYQEQVGTGQEQQDCSDFLQDCCSAQVVDGAADVAVFLRNLYREPEKSFTFHSVIKS